MPHWQVSVLNRGQLPESVYGMRHAGGPRQQQRSEIACIAGRRLDEAAGTSAAPLVAHAGAGLAVAGCQPAGFASLRMPTREAGHTVTRGCRRWRVPPRLGV